MRSLTGNELSGTLDKQITERGSEAENEMDNNQLQIKRFEINGGRIFMHPKEKKPACHPQ